jgi:RNA recognition motif-containing protein
MWLRVRNLSFQVAAPDLQSLFGNYGCILTIQVPSVSVFDLNVSKITIFFRKRIHTPENPSEMPLLNFVEEKDAAKALIEMDNYELHGRKMTVERYRESLSRSRDRRDRDRDRHHHHSRSRDRRDRDRDRRHSRSRDRRDRDRDSRHSRSRDRRDRHHSRSSHSERGRSNDDLKPGSDWRRDKVVSRMYALLLLFCFIFYFRIVRPVAIEPLAVEIVVISINLFATTPSVVVVLVPVPDRLPLTRDSKHLILGEIQAIRT